MWSSLYHLDPMNKLIPYLARRAEENTAIAGQTSQESLRDYE